MPANERQSEYVKEAELLVAALRDAGIIALKTFKTDVKNWMKAGNSPVSEGDIAVDTMLRERLMPRGYGWLSEESTDNPARLNEQRIYIVDPIDGTRSYIAGLSDWSISAALVEDGRPIAGVVYAPVTDEMFVATAGGGAQRNGIPIQAHDGRDLNGTSMAGPDSYLRRMTKSAPGIVPVKIHSLALRFARVAQGQIDAAFASVNGRDWDLAAADLLVHEARGAITDIAGETLIYNRADPVHGALIGAGRERHAVMLDLWKESA